MGKKSDSKGKSYERHVAQILSKWCGFELIRTPMSGAWQGTAGDIIPKDRSKQFPFLVECKKQENWNMEQILAGNGSFSDWLEQVHQELTQDADNGHICKSFMLIFSRNNKPDYVAIPKAHLPYKLHANFILLTTGAHVLVVLELSAFLTNYNYQDYVGNLTGSIESIPASNSS